MKLFQKKLYMKEYNQKPSIKEAKRVAERQRRVENRIRLLNLLGGECIKCGFRDYRALQLDHIDGCGTKHRNTFPNNEQLVKHYLNNITEAHQTLQLLCANCNFIKRYENQEVTTYDMYSKYLGDRKFG